MVSPLVREVLEICHEPTLPEDVYARLVSGNAFLFLLDGKGCAVIEICSDAGGRYLNVWILHYVNAVEANRDEILHWIDTTAKQAGCPVARFTSPRAWAKLLRGAFKEKSVTFERIVM